MRLIRSMFMSERVCESGRMTLGMSQPKLAAVLGIAYQQLYKYEQAKNRISASRLYE